MAMFGGSWNEDTCVPCGYDDYSCCLCASSGGGCLASMLDNYFTPATDEQLLERVKSGKYDAKDTERMTTILRNHGVITGDYKWQNEDKCTAIDSLAEAINKCNEQLENKPVLDFSGVKVVGHDSSEQVECNHGRLKSGNSLFFRISTAAFGITYREIKNIRYCPLCGKKLDK